MASSNSLLCLNAASLIVGIKPLGIVPISMLFCSTVIWWLDVASFFRSDVRSLSAFVILVLMLVIASVLVRTLFGVLLKASSSSKLSDELVEILWLVGVVLAILLLGVLILNPQLRLSVVANSGEFGSGSIEVLLVVLVIAY